MGVLLIRCGILLSIVTGIFLLAGCSPRATADTPQEKKVPVSTPTPTPSPVALQVTGTLTPMTGSVVKIDATATGRLTAFSVKEGDTVRIGQVLATISGIPVEIPKIPVTPLTQLPVSVTPDQTAAVEAARLALLAARIERDNAIKQAELALDTAEKERQKVTAGPKLEEIEQAQKTILEAEKKRDKITQTLERDRRLLGKGFLPRRTVENDETALATAESALTAASDALTQLRSGARPDEIKTVNLRLQIAGDTLNAAKEGGDVKIARLERQINQLEDTAKAATENRRRAEFLHRLAQQRRVALAQKPLSITLRSSIDGVVLKRRRKPGDKLLPGNTILEIADTHLLNLTVSVPENQAGLFTNGLAVDITCPDIPQQAFPATITKTNAVGEKIVQVGMTVKNEDKRLKPGDTVIGTVMQESTKNKIDQTAGGTASPAARKVNE